MWVDNPKVQLVIEDVLNKFDPQLLKRKIITLLVLYFVFLIDFLYSISI